MQRRVRAYGWSPLPAACQLSAARLREVGIGAAYPLTDLESDLNRCIANAGPLLRRVGHRLRRTGSARFRKWSATTRFVCELLLFSTTFQAKAVLTAAAVRPGNDLKKVPARLLPVHTAPTVVCVELAWPPFERVSPVRQPSGSDTAEDLVKLRLADEEGVVLWIRRAVVVGEIERDIVVDLDDEKGTERRGFGQAEELGQEGGRFLLVPDTDDRMVQLDAHQTDVTWRATRYGPHIHLRKVVTNNTFQCRSVVVIDHFPVCWTGDMVTVPEEVMRYLHAVTARVRDVFGDHVVGVYTTGSLALGDYRPGRSDIDLMAVVAGSEDRDLRRQLVASA